MIHIIFIKNTIYPIDLLIFYLIYQEDFAEKVTDAGKELAMKSSKRDPSSTFGKADRFTSTLVTRRDIEYLPRDR